MEKKIIFKRLGSLLACISREGNDLILVNEGQIKWGSISCNQKQTEILENCSDATEDEFIAAIKKADDSTSRCMVLVKLGQ